MTKRTFFPFFLAAAFAVVAGCATVKVSTSDPSYSFSGVRAYAWAPPSESISHDKNTYVSENVRDLLDAAFAERGWKSVEKGADLLATYYVRIEEHREYADDGEDSDGDGRPAGGLSYSREAKKWSYGELPPDVSVYVVETGTLFLSLKDAATGKIVWAGSAKVRIDRDRSHERLGERVKGAIYGLTARIPR